MILASVIAELLQLLGRKLKVRSRHDDSKKLSFCVGFESAEKAYWSHFSA